MLKSKIKPSNKPWNKYSIKEETRKSAIETVLTKLCSKKMVNNPKQIKPNDNQPTINQQSIYPKLKTILKMTEANEIQESSTKKGNTPRKKLGKE